MKQILLLIAILALLSSSLIDSIASIKGSHSIKDNILCNSCHQDVVTEFQQTIKPYPKHTSECSKCHSSSNVHAAQIKTCTSCHSQDLHMTTYLTCSTCHQPHGGQITNITHGNGNGCATCHIIHR